MTPPGPELDLLVAEKVLGWVWIELNDRTYLLPPNHECVHAKKGRRAGDTKLEAYWANAFLNGWAPVVPPYSTTNAAMTLAVSLGEDFSLLRKRGDQWYAGIAGTHDGIYGTYGEAATSLWASTFPHAICLAAVKSRTGKTP